MSEQRPEPRLSGAPKRPVPTLTEVVQVAPLPDVLIEPPPDPSSASADPPTIIALTASPMPLDLDLDALGTEQDAPVMMPDGSLGTVRRLLPASSPSPVDAAAAVAPSPSPFDPAVPAITERVLGDVQRRVDLMLEYRLRESLTPALARMTDNFIRDTRNELAATLREIVARAVEAELARERAERAERAARREE